MFSKNSYLIPQVSSFLHPRNTSAVDVNGVEILLHHEHPDMFPGHHLSTNTPSVEVASLLNQDKGWLNADPSSMGNSIQKKQTVKKDRHSKIYTAQGPRDRRVRLSIGIARKFFDLQEMLGFDKPSKTLDWLLTKSKAAIKELVQTKIKAVASANSSSSPYECELLSSAENGEAFENGADSKMVFCSNNKKAKDPQQTAVNLAKESRAKARARARERTREKICIKQLKGTRSNVYGLNASISIQNRNNQLEFFQLCAGSSNNSKAKAGFREPTLHYPVTKEAEAEDLIQESILIKRKSKSPSFFGVQQNLIVSRDLDSNYIIPSGNVAENWDVCSFTSQSNMYAILDQQKFIYSNSNI